MGLDFSIDWEISDSIRSGVSYEYVKATFEETIMRGQEYLWFQKAYLGYTSNLPVDSLWLNLGGSYVGESFRGRIFLTLPLGQNERLLAI